ncbi:hypothetical protein [Natronorubrum daqingense]|nr:hypothetical protein [Natronorubrum daqingense]
MKHNTPSKDRSVATPPDSGAENLEHNQPPSLDDLESDELIVCRNPRVASLQWFYELDEDGTVLTYHSLNEYDVQTGTKRYQADRSIASDGVETAIVSRDAFEAIRGDA